MKYEVKKKEDGKYKIVRKEKEEDKKPTEEEMAKVAMKKAMDACRK